MKIIGSDVYNAWNGEVSIAVTGPATYTLTYQNVPTGDPCIDLGKATRKMGFDSMSIDGNDEDVTDISINDIISHCDSSGTNNYVEFIWTR